ncbi:MAG: hypothetical protein AB7V47_09795 [Phycisphaerales bacterium]
MRLLPATIALAALAGAAAPTLASFHFMQIEQIVGGVGGDSSIQAIQLRMRFGSQNFVNNCVIKVFDAQGQNPITLVTCNRNLAVGAGGSRILIASPNFAAATSPDAAPDFVMTNVIPASYLAAGRMTWELNNIIYWSFAWGGASYTGSNLGAATNDADGNFGAPFPGALPSTTTQAVFFNGAFGAASTNNAAQYLLTPAAATFINNAGDSFVIDEPVNPCPQDFNGDMIVNADDLGDYINCYFSVPPCDQADFNQDGTTDADDLGDYINAYFGPAC